MDLLRPRDLRELVEAPARPSVSIYMPSHRAGPETRQDPIRLKNLLGQAEERLLEEGVERPDAREILDPAQALLDDEEFWKHQGDGLALFLSKDHGRAFRLPLTFDETLVTGDRYHVKPLFPLLAGDARFLILAVSQKEIRLLQATRQVIHEVELEEVPDSLREVAVHREMRFLNYHTGTGFSGGGRRSAVFHGHGDQTDEELIRKYLRAIDQGIRSAIEDERSPLVLAGVRYLLDTYRAVSEYPAILPDIVQGNPDELSNEELHAQARPLVEARARQRVEEAVGRFEEQSGTGLAVSGVDEVVPAAAHGRVEVLWVALGVQRWGAFDEETASVEVREQPRRGDEDLLDRAAADALLSGGTIYAVDPGAVPGDAPIAALLRY
ncbi:MAG TPA: hypothetical protein VMP42_10490 [Actinomycetota bacterium]|nr:hypothetical protein [Actinomycetota bacterium]